MKKKNIKRTLITELCSMYNRASEQRVKIRKIYLGDRLFARVFKYLIEENFFDESIRAVLLWGVDIIRDTRDNITVFYDNGEGVIYKLKKGNLLELVSRGVLCKVDNIK